MCELTIVLGGISFSVCVFSIEYYYYTGYLFLYTTNNNLIYIQWSYISHWMWALKWNFGKRKNSPNHMKRGAASVLYTCISIKKNCEWNVLWFYKYKPHALFTRAVWTWTKYITVLAKNWSEKKFLRFGLWVEFWAGQAQDMMSLFENILLKINLLNMQNK